MHYGYELPVLRQSLTKDKILLRYTQNWETIAYICVTWPAFIILFYSELLFYDCSSNVNSAFFAFFAARNRPLKAHRGVPQSAGGERAQLLSMHSYICACAPPPPRQDAKNLMEAI